MSQVDTIHGVLKDAAERSPENPAIFSVDRRPLDYRSLVEQIETIVECLNCAGVGASDRVAVVIENGPEAAVCCLAVAESATCVPLNPACSAAEFELYFQESSPSALIVDSRTANPASAVARAMNIPVIKLVGGEISGLFHLECEELRPCSSPGLAQPDNVAMLLFTTGTTSRPKMVPITHRSLCHSARTNAEILALKAEDRCLNVMPLFHIHGLAFAVLSSLYAGSSVVCTPGFDASEFFRWLSAFRPTWYTAAPTMHHAILKQAGENTQAITNAFLRFIRSGASALPTSVMSELERVFSVPVIEAYAMTETGLISINRLPPGKRKAGSVGLPSGCEIAVVDDQGNRLPAGEIGNVAVRGAGVTRGYERNPEANQRAFVDGWFYTGDLGRLDSDGYLSLTGRTSETINRGGEKIAPGEIEEVLLQHPAVEQALAFAAPHFSLGEQVAACVVLRPHANAANSELMEFQLQEFVANRLAMFKVPYRIKLLSEIPKGPTGKPQRQGLAALLGMTSAPSHSSSVAPRSFTEDRLIAIWQAVLGRSNIGTHDDFFELGGDSIFGAQVIVRIGKEFKVALPLFRLFHTPTIAGLAEWLESDGKLVKPDFALLQQFPRPEHLPLAYAQQRLWFMAQMEGGSRPYHMPMAFHLRGALNVVALRLALNRIIARHEALRTTFAVVEGQPVQRIAEVGRTSFQLLEHDLHGREEADLMRLVEEEAGVPFALEAGPLIRGRLIRTGEQHHALLITMHHIVSDGWSMGVLMEELSALYRAYVEGEEDYLPELKVQYADYAVWQRKWMEGEALQQQAEYWKSALAGAPGLLELPADYERPAQQDYAGAFVELALEEDLTKGLAELSRARGTTMFMTLLAGWAALLGRLSGQQEVVIGTPVANRGRSEIEKLIGCFINTLAVRVDLSGEPTVAELLERVKVQTLTGQQHQDLPFEHVVELLQPVRSLAHTPLFQVMFVWQNTPGTKLEFPGLEVEELRPARMTTKFDLTLSLRPAGRKIIGGVMYATALFERETVEHYLGYLRTLLGAMAAGDGQQLVDRLPLLSEQERQQVLYEWNDTNVEYPVWCADAEGERAQA
ncbi:MAG: AMP-binding protein [Acidobacteriia bacterium]|nr:AMP-binding protein [Terriglobia bacterium]